MVTLLLKMLMWFLGFFEIDGWIVLHSLRRRLSPSLTYIEKTINMLMILLFLVFIFLDLNGRTQFLLILVMSLLEIDLIFLNIDFVNLVWSTALFFLSPNIFLRVLQVFNEIVVYSQIRTGFCTNPPKKNSYLFFFF
jgi:hypothetical protein